MDFGYAMEIVFSILLVGFLVFLNGFFVAVEFAIVKIRDTQLEPLVSKGHKRAKIARRIVHNLDAALSATQLGITLASLGLGWVGEPVFARMLEPLLEALNIKSPEAQHRIAFAVGFSAITFLHIVLGELAPQLQQDPRVEISGAGSHHQALERGHAHAGLHAAAILDGRDAGAAAEVTGDDAQFLRRLVQVLRDAGGHITMTDAVKSKAPDAPLLPFIRYRIDYPMLRQRREKTLCRLHGTGRHQ